MRVDISWWDLAGTPQTIESLSADVATQVWTKVPGLKLKLWLADPEGNRWGAVMIWEPGRPDGPLPPNQAAELIGRPATQRASFEVAASAEGVPV